MEDNRIPLAWSVRWRRIRAQGIPIVCFAVAALLCGWLLRERGAGVIGIGEVASPHYDVKSPVTGLVEALPNETNGSWSVYDHIEAGEIVARVKEESPDAGKTVEIQAPISGTLVEIHCHPGETVIPGELIARIAADQGRHIVGYIPEESSLQAKPGMRVTLRTRVGNGKPMESKVETVGSQIERVPRHQRENTKAPEWGTPVRIKMPQEAALRPGSLVDLHFDGSGAL